MLPLPAKSRAATYGLVIGVVVVIFLVGMLVAVVVGDAPTEPIRPAPASGATVGSGVPAP